MEGKMATKRKKTYAPPLTQNHHGIDFDEDQAGLIHNNGIKYTQEALAHITPRGKCITATKEEVFSIILASARRTKRQKDPIIEAIGSVYKPAK
ncbi:hypothetical protein F9U45_10760 [Pectobacterium versatile]|nr:hypothetical protein [Pectobacterium carotovorum subsp. carotovorum]MBQ4776303.1 hypothetical protein [Pectobacterium versatile]MBQ4792887.1 hypothetical protein [Pectobacterium versatile]MCL6399009.1 hypothetical protein [Pectobacterium carotovorum subsp. carotovorum]TAJ06028.1 hypothetical protein EG334_02060 [Pectobacterium versatile]